MLNRIDEALKTYIKKAIQNETLTSAYIFEGSAGVGRMELAKYTAKALLCTHNASKVTPCDNCHACKLIESGNHPDLVAVTHEKPNTISVKDIRTQVVEDISIRPYYGGRKIYIIPDAELMSKEAQNALLKTIEEPPVYALIILIVKSRELLLQTIRSRCITLSFRAEPLFHADDEAVAMQFEKMKNIISGNIPYDTVYLMEFAKELASDYFEYLPELLTYIETICRDALFVKNGILLTDTSPQGYIDKTSVISYESLERILNAVKKARRDLLINVSAETVMDCMLMNIKQACTRFV